MSNQNIYDNQVFFDCYLQLREKDDCYNDILEQPAITDMLPPLKDKTVLDLGCGYGSNCVDFINRGAKSVVGIDISSKMLEIASRKNKNDKIKYLNMSMTDIASLNESFDFIYSSLAFHYIEDFAKLICNTYNLLNPGGTLLYSQEHPIITATIDGEGHFNRDASGKHVSYTFSNYNQSGKRTIHWFIDGVEKYHRTMGEIITTIAKQGFIIEELCEPTPKEDAINKLPSIVKEYIKPNFLIVKARKCI